MTTATTTRKRGGQPGNTNALKHGFYAQYFSPGEDDDLGVYSGEGLADEINLLRVLIRRFASQIQASEGVALSDAAYHLSVISEALARLGSMLRTNHMLGNPGSSGLPRALERCIEQVWEELSGENGEQAQPEQPQVFLPSAAS